MQKVNIGIRDIEMADKLLNKARLNVATLQTATLQAKCAFEELEAALKALNNIEIIYDLHQGESIQESQNETE